MVYTNAVYVTDKVWPKPSALDIEVSQARSAVINSPYNRYKPQEEKMRLAAEAEAVVRAGQPIVKEEHQSGVGIQQDRYD